MPRVIVGPLPPWMPVADLLGPGDWQPADAPATVQAELDRPVAADVAARLRGLAFGGLDLQVRIVPPLKRTHVRAGRTRDARARRDTTPGFTRRGVRLDDDEGHRSLTPEALALDLGRAAQRAPILDLTAGAGGNAIGFARAGCPVVAVERDATRLDLARHNARVYEVDDRITFVHGDAVEILADPPEADLVFVDPPWGGWDKRRTTLDDLPLLAALRPGLAGRRWWAKVPPSFDPATVPVPVEVQPIFGRAPGDRHRVKFLLLRHDG